jgi:hypothetical protein
MATPRHGCDEVSQSSYLAVPDGTLSELSCVALGVVLYWLVSIWYASKSPGDTQPREEFAGHRRPPDLVRAHRTLTQFV